MDILNVCDLTTSLVGQSVSVRGYFGCRFDGRCWLIARLNDATSPCALIEDDLRPLLRPVKDVPRPVGGDLDVFGDAIVDGTVVIPSHPKYFIGLS
jgi:hypothetical protein